MGLDLGWSHRRVAAAVVALTLTTGIGALIMVVYHRVFGMFLAAVGLALIVAGTVWVEARDRSFD